MKNVLLHFLWTYLCLVICPFESAAVSAKKILYNCWFHFSVSQICSYKLSEPYDVLYWTVVTSKNKYRNIPRNGFGSNAVRLQIIPSLFFTLSSFSFLLWKDTFLTVLWYSWRWLTAPQLPRNWKSSKFKYPVNIIPAVGDRKLRTEIKMLVHLLFPLIAKANGRAICKY